MKSAQPNAITIRSGLHSDAPAIRDLYLTVAKIAGGLARLPEEITVAYVEDFVDRSLADGVLLVVETEEMEAIVGEIHAYRNGLQRFEHVLSDLTVAVHPAAQGQRIGRRLFDALLAEVVANRPTIARIELITQESNIRGQRLYESVGFRRQGRFEQGIRSPQGGFEADIPMAWLRPRNGEQHH